MKTKQFHPSQYLSSTDREIVAAQRQRDELDRYIEGLQAARQAMSQHVLKHVTTVPKRRHNDAGSGTNRSAMLKTILDNANGLVTVDDLVDELRRHGIVADGRLVASTLSYLKRKGLAKNPERAKWASATELVAA